MQWAAPVSFTDSLPPNGVPEIDQQELAIRNNNLWSNFLWEVPGDEATEATWLRRAMDKANAWESYNDELLVHRVRFLQTQARPIHRLAFSKERRERAPRLAVARGDCSLELWVASRGDGARYYRQLFVPGRRDVSVESLVWVGRRLFSAGLTG